MRSSESPVVATWLLDHFGAGSGNDALLGDIVEQYRSGRSRGWFWRQVFVAIAVGAWKEIRTHKLLACRACLMCWGILFLEVTIIRYAIITLDPNSTTVYSFFATVDRQDLWLYYADVFRALTWLPLAAQFFAAGFSGWISARFHRPYERALMLGCVASWCAIELPVILFVLFTDGPLNTHGFTIAILWNCLTIAGVVAGALISSNSGVGNRAHAYSRGMY